MGPRGRPARPPGRRPRARDPRRRGLLLGLRPTSATTAASSRSPRRSPPTSRWASSAKDIVIAATHAHSSPDFIGGWGFVPDWYMKQVSETIKATIRDGDRRACARPSSRYGEQRRARFNQRAPRHLPLRRGAAARLAARLRATAPERQGRRRSSPSAPTPPTRRRWAPTAASRTRTGPGRFEKEPREPLRRHRPALHDRPGEHVERPRQHAEPRRSTSAALIADLGKGNKVDEPRHPDRADDLAAAGDQRAADRPRPPRVLRPQVPRRARRRVRTGEDPDKPSAPRRRRSSVEVAVVGRPHRRRVRADRRRPARSSPTSPTPSRRTRAPPSPSRSARPTTRSATCRSRSSSARSASRASASSTLDGYAVVNYEDAYAIDSASATWRSRPRSACWAG